MKTMGYTGDDITVISYNGNQNGYDFVVNGDIYATMIQSMKWIGEKTMEITNEYLQAQRLNPFMWKKPLKRSPEIMQMHTINPCYGKEKNLQ